IWMFIGLLSSRIRSSDGRSGGKLAGVYAGLFSGLSFLTYPGNYHIPVILAASLAYQTYTRGSRATLGLLYMSVTFLTTLGAVELLAYSGDVSLVAGLRLLSDTVTIGSFNESLIFIVRYFRDVDPWMGTLIVSGCISFATLKRLKLCDQQKKSRELELLFYLVVALYLVHGFFGYFAHHMVFYGRLLTFFMPFLILTCVAGLGFIPNTWVRGATLLTLVTVSFLSVLINTQKLRAVAYP
ncbi:MAG: hypothetical protein KDD42_06205, partial [Bdellovibrionales bacterium]|nr:hypothetical protein [Bdellovibrionales bacterium]